jgi:predicted phosphodiesterase
VYAEPERILVISDTHLARPGKAAGRSAWLRPLWQGFDELIVNGDLAETSDPHQRGPAARQVLELTQLCEDDGVKLTLISGNHDPLITDRRYLRLRGGDVFLTHGDILHPAISPWSEHRHRLQALYNDALQSLDPDATGSIEARHLATQLASRMKWDDLHEPADVGKLRRAIGMADKLGRTLWYWHRLPRDAAAFARRYVPECRYFLFGHIHRAGIWPLGGRTIINTGSYQSPKNPRAVALVGETLTVHKVQQDPQDHLYHLADRPLLTATTRPPVGRKPAAAAA